MSNVAIAYKGSGLEAFRARLEAAANAEGERKVGIELGDEEDARRGSPPRITIVVGEGDGRIAPVQRTRSDLFAAHELALYLEAHCWGENFEQAHELFSRLDRALFVEAGGAYAWAGKTKQIPGNAAATRRGFMYVAPFFLARVPLSHEAKTYVDGEVASATGTFHAGDVESDGPTISAS